MEPYYLSLYIYLYGSPRDELMSGNIAVDELVLDQLSDQQLQRFETKVGAPSKNTQPYVPTFPLRILQALVGAGAVVALPLVLAMHRQLVMTGRDRTPLNATLWATAGSPSRKERGTILTAIRRLPGIVEVHPRRTSASHYDLGRGGLW